MNAKAFGVVVISFLAVLFATLAPSSADDIKARMIQRLPVIGELKAKGIVGENTSGYLEFTGTNREKNDVVTAENDDRRSIYGTIAKQEGATIEFVGKRRAQQIAKRANKGEWLQDESGKWHRK